MMSKNSMNGRNQFAMVTVDDWMPKDHLVERCLRLPQWIWKNWLRG